MIPTSAAALVLLLALLPGYFYLHLTRDLRAGHDANSLREVFLIVAMGLFTSGLVLAIALLVYPDLGLGFSRPIVSEHAVRNTVGAIAGGLACASIVAWLLSLIAHTRASADRYSPTVWENVLDDPGDNLIRHVVVELEDGRSFDGPIAAFTVVDKGAGRQIAIQKPVRVTFPSQKVRVGPFGIEKEVPRRIASVGYDRMVFEASAIRFAAVTYVKDPSKQP